MPFQEGGDAGSQGGTPGDHDGLAVVYSDPIAVLGSREVIADAVATNAATLSAAVWYFAASMSEDALADDSSWATASDAGYTVLGSIITKDLSAAARRMAAGAPLGFYHGWARLKLTVGASAITGLAVSLRNG
jgi:hypothetical protein